MSVIGESQNRPGWDLLLKMLVFRAHTSAQTGSVHLKEVRGPYAVGEEQLRWRRQINQLSIYQKLALIQTQMLICANKMHKNTLSCLRKIRKNKDDLAKMIYKYEPHYRGNIMIPINIILPLQFGISYSYDRYGTLAGIPTLH